LFDQSGEMGSGMAMPDPPGRGVPIGGGISMPRPDDSMTPDDGVELGGDEVAGEGGGICSVRAAGRPAPYALSLVALLLLFATRRHRPGKR
jgi:MYXO-CTERM domain-containing protein